MALPLMIYKSSASGRLLCLKSRLNVFFVYYRSCFLEIHIFISSILLQVVSATLHCPLTRFIPYLSLIYPLSFFLFGYYTDFCSRNVMLGALLKIYSTGRIEALEKALEKAASVDSTIKYAEACRDSIIPVMKELRMAADQLEFIVDADLWPLPTYAQMLFLRCNPCGPPAAAPVCSLIIIRPAAHFYLRLPRRLRILSEIAQFCFLQNSQCRFKSR